MSRKKRKNRYFWKLRCVICEHTFEGRRQHALTCSAACRKKLSRQHGLTLSEREKPIPLGFRWGWQPPSNALSSQKRSAGGPAEQAD